MIRNLDNRIKIYTILFIALFIGFMTLTSYGAFTKILTDDFVEKSVRISKQQASNAETAIKNIEEMNSIIIADLKLDNPEHYRAHDSSYIGALTSYGASSPYFTSFVVYRNDELLYYNIPASVGMFNIRDIDIAAAKSTDFDENGIGWHIAESGTDAPDFLLLARKIPAGEDVIYIIFQVDTSYLSDRFSVENNFANHSAVMLKSNRNGAFLRLSKMNADEKKKNAESISHLNGEFSKNGKKSLITKADTGDGIFTFYVKDDISQISGYTKNLALIYTLILIFALVLGYFAVSMLSKSMKMQLEKIRLKMQNYY